MGRPMCTSGSAKARALANMPSASFSASNGGCLYLISTGESAEPSYFGDASANGDDVFFFTRQSLVGQDRDENYDIYDARIDGGIAAQNQCHRRVAKAKNVSVRSVLRRCSTRRRARQSRAMATSAPTESKPTTKSKTRRRRRQEAQVKKKSKGQDT